MTLPTLYELADEYLVACERLADTSLPVEVVQDTLEGLAGELQEKATNVGMFIANMEATARAIKEAEEKMETRRKAIEMRCEWLRNYLKEQMERTGIQKIDSPYLSLSVRKNPPKVYIDSASQIPEEYWYRPPAPPPFPDKKHIADDIKSGAEVPGAHLEQSTRLVIS